MRENGEQVISITIFWDKDPRVKNAALDDIKKVDRFAAYEQDGIGDGLQDLKKNYDMYIGLIEAAYCSDIEAAENLAQAERRLRVVLDDQQYDEDPDDFIGQYIIQITTWHHFFKTAPSIVIWDVFFFF